MRDAVTTGWPAPLQLEEHSHAGMANRYVAGASGLPFAVLRGYQGTDLPQHTATISTVVCPFTGERLAAVAALNPDVTVVHAQRADRAGNVQLWGITGVQKEAVLAARRALVTVEELVDELEPMPGAVVLPELGARRGGGRPGRRGAVLRARLLRPRQRRLPGLGPDQPGPGRVHPLAAGPGARTRRPHDRGDPDQARRTGAADPAGRRDPPPPSPIAGADPAPSWTADEMMTIAAARSLRDGQACFVGIGLPSTAANLARRLHAPNLALIYESGTLGSRPDELPLSIGDGILADVRAGRGERAGGLQLLAAARPGGRRVPLRGPDRPLRQHQHDGDRQLRRAGGAAARLRRRPGDRRVLPRGDGDHAAPAAGLRRAGRLRHLGRARHRAGRPGAARACAAPGRSG